MFLCSDNLLYVIDNYPYLIQRDVFIREDIPVYDRDLGSYKWYDGFRVTSDGCVEIHVEHFNDSDIFRSLEFF